MRNEDDPRGSHKTKMRRHRSNSTVPRTGIGTVPGTGRLER